VLLRLHAHIQSLTQEIQAIEAELVAQVKADDAGQRLLSIPGIGPITASALAANAGDASQFRSGRDFAASLGLVPRQYSTGGRARFERRRRSWSRRTRRMTRCKACSALPASGRSRPVRWRPMPGMLPNFAAVATLPPRSGWFRANTRRADVRTYWG